MSWSIYARQSVRISITSIPRINAIFIGKQFTAEEMGNINNWIPVEMDKTGIQIAQDKYMSTWANIAILLPQNVSSSKTLPDVGLLQLEGPATFEAKFEKWEVSSHLLELREKKYNYNPNDNLYYRREEVTVRTETKIFPPIVEVIDGIEIERNTLITNEKRTNIIYPEKGWD